MVSRKSAILGEPVGRMKVRAEETLMFSSDYRSLRLDIYAGASGSFSSLCGAYDRCLGKREQRALNRHHSRGDCQLETEPEMGACCWESTLIRK